MFMTKMKLYVADRYVSWQSSEWIAKASPRLDSLLSADAWQCKFDSSEPDQLTERYF